MEARRTVLIPRLTVSEQLLRNPGLKREISGRSPALVGTLPKGLELNLRRATDMFDESGKFAPLLEIKGYGVQFFTPKGMELELTSLIGRSAEEIDNLAARIDAASQVRPVRSLAEDIGISIITIPAGEFIFQRYKGVRHNGHGTSKTEFTNLNFRLLIEKESDALEKILKYKPMILFEKSLKASAEGTTKDKENSPLVLISQIESTAIAELIGMRLPTELEAERARAYTDGRDYPYGNTFDIKRHTFEDKGTRSVYAHSEGKRSGASPEEVLDLSGNVWEWTSTLYGEIDFTTDPKNPIFSRESSSYSIRGGSWVINVQDYLTGSIRFSYGPEYRYDFIGFRPAEDLTP